MSPFPSSLPSPNSVPAVTRAGSDGFSDEGGGAIEEREIYTFYGISSRVVQRWDDGSRNDVMRSQKEELIDKARLAVL